MAAPTLQQWNFTMQLNRNLRAKIKSMSVEELATKYAISTNTTVQGGGLINPQDMHYELMLRLGKAGADRAVAQAREVLKMVGDHDQISPNPLF